MVLAAVLAATMAMLATPTASAATGPDRTGGVEIMTANGRHLTGEPARATYARYLTQGCGGCQKFVAIDASKMPFIARNISTAWATGKPVNLTKANAAQNAANRKV